MTALSPGTGSRKRPCKRRILWTGGLLSPLDQQCPLPQLRQGRQRQRQQRRLLKPQCQVMRSNILIATRRQQRQELLWQRHPPQRQQAKMGKQLIRQRYPPQLRGTKPFEANPQWREDR